MEFNLVSEPTMAKASNTPQNADPAIAPASISSSTATPALGNNHLSPFGANLTQNRFCKAG